MLLYAFSCPEFVIDTYTKRVFQNLGFLEHTEKYEEWKNFFEESLKTKPEPVPLYQEYHALIVEHAKKYYQKKPYGAECTLKEFLKKYS